MKIKNSRVGQTAVEHGDVGWQNRHGSRMSMHLERSLIYVRLKEERRQPKG